jgi:hypothetical protein
MIMNNEIYSFRLNKIKTEQFAVLEENLNKKNETIHLVSSNTFGANIVEKIIAVRANFKFLSEQNIFLVLEISCLFMIEDISWKKFHSTDSTNLVVVPKNLATHLLVLTVGTARGILHAKTENTDYNKFFLPVLDVSNLIQEDVVINIGDRLEEM